MSGVFQSLWDRLFSFGAYSGSDDWLIRLAAAIIVGFLTWALTKTFWWAAPKVTVLLRSVSQVKRALAAVAPSSRGLWLASSIKIKHPSNYAQWLRTSIPIYVIANLKGGVGKTTTAVNLAAYHAIKMNRRVLLIDFDFQGSCTVSALSRETRDRLMEQQAEGEPCKAAALIAGKDADWLFNTHESVKDVEKARIIPAYYSLANAENRVMIEWLLGKSGAEMRYHLAEVLHSERIQKRFDVIIIDAPPRLTTAAVQALCAATDVVIPTVLDELSAEAVAAFADQLRIGQELWPHLAIAGVLGTMTEQLSVKEGRLRDKPLSDYENDAYILARDLLARALLRSSPPLSDATLLPIECFIPDKTELGRAAAKRIAYATGSGQAGNEIREAFDRLGAELDRRFAARRSR